ncbi:MAG: GSU3473 family protein [Smithella sp.]
MSTTYINVRYNRENYGITPRQRLDELIASNVIIQFYRESEKNWVTIGVDPIRNMDRHYNGLERRAH